MSPLRRLSALRSLKAVAHTVPAVYALLMCMSDVFCPSVRILFLAFERDRWRHNSRSGRRHLATMLLTLPDTKVVEDTHQHLRDLQRRMQAKHHKRHAAFEAHCPRSPWVYGTLWASVNTQEQDPHGPIGGP